ncbi:MAG: inositol monophosphatase [Candidatus Yonathbacteria bacterium]|nr:inositol monophosphatase [Candidatus Yonathbacteria bacterium]
MDDYTQKLEVAIRAAVAAGNILHKHAGDAFHLTRIRKESFRDVVTEADTYAEKKIIEMIRQYDNSPIVSEEAGVVGELDEEKSYWVVDPLDGTVNYAHHMPFYAVSIAYMEQGVPVVGVIYNPALNELFYGAKGLGVYKNHNKIATIDRKPEDALFAVSFSGKKYDSDARLLEFVKFKEINDKTMGCLRTGSAALNLAYLAEGRLGGCVGRFNKIWDVAAGFIIAELAGAKVNHRVDKNDRFLLSYTATVPQSEGLLKEIVVL